MSSLTLNVPPHRQQSALNTLQKTASIELEYEIEETLTEHQFFHHFHFSHKLKRYGVSPLQPEGKLSYNTKRINGITFLVFEDEETNKTKVYASVCSVKDTFHRLTGYLESLKRYMYKPDSFSLELDGIEHSRYTIVNTFLEKFNYKDIK